jgi:hypothetical protein
MPDALPTDPLELEALAEKVREFLRVSRLIPIVVVEKREPTKGASVAARHYAALAEIEGCVLVEPAAFDRCEAVSYYGVPCLRMHQFDKLVVPVHPFHHPELEQGAIRVASGDPERPFDNMVVTSRETLRETREDADGLLARIGAALNATPEALDSPMDPAAANGQGKAHRDPRPSASVHDELLTLSELIELIRKLRLSRPITKKMLEALIASGVIPQPCKPASGRGKAAKWKLSILRPIVAQEYGVHIPDASANDAQSPLDTARSAPK